MKSECSGRMWYVCPFTFIIEPVKIEFCVMEDRLYYIDNVGAYLAEDDLFYDLKDAKDNAFDKLNNFYQIKTNEIMNKRGNLQDFL